jgi:hypothetical protein
MTQTIEARIRDVSSEGTLACAKGLALAEELGVYPMEVGDAANRLGIRISKCQMGLFGYGPKEEGKHRIVQSLENVPPQWEAALREVASSEGDLACSEAHRIARQVGSSYLDISNAAEGLGIHIRQCQLGCFP